MNDAAQSRFERGLRRTVDNAESLHWVNSPRQGAAIVQLIRGYIKSLDERKIDDPLLYAYAIKDMLPSIATAVIQLEKWTVAVIDATPDQIDEKGAQLCH